MLTLEVLHRKLDLIGSPLPLVLPTIFGLPTSSSNSQTIGLTQEIDNHSCQTSTTPISMPTIVIPFKALNPNYKKWSILDHIVLKTNIHEYTNQRGLVKLFDFDLLDCSGEEIHVSTFNNFFDSFLFPC